MSKTTESYWFDLFHRRGSLRDFLRVGASAASLVALGALPGCSRSRPVRVTANHFALGVASGDPTSDGVVLWSRLARSTLEESGAHLDPIAVRWEVAEDDAFRRIVRTGTGDAGFSTSRKSIILDQ